MGGRLTGIDEGTHPVGTASNWNESRYVDVWDNSQRVGAWLRIGMRPNEGRAEMSVCAYLPGGRVAFLFDRPGITGNGMSAGGQDWAVETAFRSNRVRYDGELLLLNDPWLLTDPGRAYRESARVQGSIDLLSTSGGLQAVMGKDQSHIDRIFLPGQADFHYQHLVHSIGRISLDGQSWVVDGFGGRDHSWGPRNWHAKIYLRWMICAIDDRNGFMLVRAVGPTKSTRSGHVLVDGEFRLVDDFDMRNSYADPPHHELRCVEVDIRAGDLRWSAVGRPQAWLPLRHRQQTTGGPGGTGDKGAGEATLRIVKSPTDWQFADGRTGAGHCEYHDLMESGRPVGLDD